MMNRHELVLAILLSNLFTPVVSGDQKLKMAELRPTEFIKPYLLDSKTLVRGGDGWKTRIKTPGASESIAYAPPSFLGRLLNLTLTGCKTPIGFNLKHDEQTGNVIIKSWFIEQKVQEAKEDSGRNLLKASAVQPVSPCEFSDDFTVCKDETERQYEDGEVAKLITTVKRTCETTMPIHKLLDYIADDLTNKKDSNKP